MTGPIALARAKHREAVETFRRLGCAVFGATREPSEDELTKLALVALQAEAAKAAAELLARQAAKAKDN